MYEETYDFGLRLKKLREEQGLTQRFVANKLGITVTSIKNYERNEQLPPIDKLEAMALLYKTSLDYLRNLDKRKPDLRFYIGDLPENKQEMILNIIEIIRNDYNKNFED